jgi:ubiquinone/menaquinone biosynthesis C-methylase UbiE
VHSTDRNDTARHHVGDETWQRWAIRRQRRVWESRGRSWHHHQAHNTGLQQVVAAVVDAALTAAGPTLGAVVDLGCGSGQITLPLAEHAGSVLAVDVSATMLDELRQRALKTPGGERVETRLCAIEQLRLPPASVDLVVSNYALHHLRDRDKETVLANARQWLRSGGVLVVGDMMLGRGTDAADRAIIAGKVKQFARRGPAGWWRIAKNAARYLLRMHERPVSSAAWTAMASRHGFVEVTVRGVVNEAAILVARCP